MMDNKDKYLYWLDTAEYDMSTADAMLSSGRYLYVAFMCQQALEKLAKGLYTFYIGDDVPRVHNIDYILTKVTDSLKVEVSEEYRTLFDRLSAYYLQGRYPSFKENISQLVDKKEALDILTASKEVFIWMQKLKELKK